MIRASFGLYPSLRRYFDSFEGFADAGCMSPRRARDCLRGVKQFTVQEKRAIARAVMLKDTEVIDLDKTFRVKE